MELQFADQDWKDQYHPSMHTQSSADIVTLLHIAASSEKHQISVMKAIIY